MADRPGNGRAMGPEGPWPLRAPGWRGALGPEGSYMYAPAGALKGELQWPHGINEASSLQANR